MKKIVALVLALALALSLATVAFAAEDTAYLAATADSKIKLENVTLKEIKAAGEKNVAVYDVVLNLNGKEVPVIGNFALATADEYDCVVVKGEEVVYLKNTVAGGYTGEAALTKVVAKADAKCGDIYAEDGVVLYDYNGKIMKAADSWNLGIAANKAVKDHVTEKIQNATFTKADWEKGVTDFFFDKDNATALKGMMDRRDFGPAFQYIVAGIIEKAQANYGDEYDPADSILRVGDLVTELRDALVSYDAAGYAADDTAYGKFKTFITTTKGWQLTEGTAPDYKVKITYDGTNVVGAEIIKAEVDAYNEANPVNKIKIFTAVPQPGDAGYFGGAFTNVSKAMWNGFDWELDNIRGLSAFARALTSDALEEIVDNIFGSFKFASGYDADPLETDAAYYGERLEVNLFREILKQVTTVKALALVDGKLVTLTNAVEGTDYTVVKHAYDATVEDGKITKVTCSTCGAEFNFVVGCKADAEKALGEDFTNITKDFMETYTTKFLGKHSVGFDFDVMSFTASWEKGTGYYWNLLDKDELALVKALAGKQLYVGTAKAVKSADTFDAGIALYAGLALMSVTGSAVVIGKKKEF